MPEGNKVGDAYIEVTPELDVKKLLAQSNAAMEKLEARWAAQSKRIAAQLTSEHLDGLRSIEKAHLASSERIAKAAGKTRASQISADRVAIQKTTKLHIDEVNKRAKATSDAFKRVNSRLAAAAPDVAPQAAKVVKAPTQTDGGKRPGSLNRGGGVSNAIQNTLSILPGQLEKLFNDPRTAAIAVGGAATLAGAFGAAFTDFLGAAVGTGLVGGAAVLFAKTDPVFAQAGKSAGLSMVNALLTSLGPLKPLIAGVMTQATNTINNLITSIDIKPLQSIAVQLSSMFDRLAPTVGSIIDRLSTIGAQSMPAISDAVAGVLSSFDRLFATVENDSENTNAAIRGIGVTLQGLVEILNLSIQGVLGFTAALTATSGAVTKFVDSGKDIPGVGTVIDALTGGPVRDLVNGLKDTSSEAAKVGSGKSLTSLGAQALVAAGGLTASGKAAEDAAKAQKDLNSAIDAYNAHALDVEKNTLNFKNGQVELAAALKKSKGSISESTQAGRDSKAVVISQIEKAHDLARAIFETTGSADKANAAFARSTAQIRGTAGASGAAKKAIDEMAGRYKAFAGTPNIRKSIVVNADGTENVEATLNHLARDRIARIITTTSGGGQRVSNKPGQVFSGSTREPGAATGGLIKGPGTGTSDSIPARLSDGEYVIKASAAKKLGLANLNALNSGQMPVARATGGTSKAAARPTRFQALQGRELLLLKSELAVLRKAISAQAASAARLADSMKSIRGSFDQFTNLSSIDAQGKTAGAILTELRGRRAQQNEFRAAVEDLKRRGLGAEGVSQLLQAGPDSPLAKTLKAASAFDIGLINKTLDDKLSADRFAKVLDPKGVRDTTRLAINRRRENILAKRTAALQKKAGKFQPKPGSTRTVLFSKAELAQMGMRSGQSIKVIIDGKEVRAIVRQENAKSSKKASTSMRRGR